MTQAQFKDKLKKLVGIIMRLEVEAGLARNRGDYDTKKLKEGALYFARKEFDRLGRNYYKLYLQKC